VQFLRNKFKFLVKRFFLMGPPGSDRKDHAKRMRDTFGMNLIETSALLKKEVIRNTEYSQQI
jgi:hypothetical protein